MTDIFAVTGTKGKTTVARVLADVLGTVRDPLLLVDTTGAYVNGKQVDDLKGSLRTAGLVPSVSPGRYMTLLHDKPLENAIAVLETSLGSSNSAGLGYRVHRVGIFTNVFEDHIGSSKRLNTRDDIADAKQFIFKRIALDGYAVFNADDPYVVKKLKVLPKKRNITKIACSLKKGLVEKQKIIIDGGVFVTVEDGFVTVTTKQKTEKVIKLAKVSWTFEGGFQPSVYNLMFVVGALYGYFKSKIPAEVIRALESSKLREDGGRLTVFKNNKGVKIIADYAHEKYSLVEVAKLARSLTSENGRVIGVLRLAYDRTQELIVDTAKHIAPHYDEFVIYDKIDGYWKQPSVFDKRIKFIQEVGKISQYFYDGLIDAGATATRIIREDQALEHAASIARSGDVVVEIVNDDIPRSLEFIKAAFDVQKEDN